SYKTVLTTETLRSHRGSQRRTLWSSVRSLCLCGEFLPIISSPRERRLLLIQDPQLVVTRIRLHGRLVHEFCARWRDPEFAGHFYAHCILKRRIAIKIILEDDGAVVAKLAVAVPIRPRPGRVVQVNTADLRYLL